MTHPIRFPRSLSIDELALGTLAWLVVLSTAGCSSSSNESTGAGGAGGRGTTSIGGAGLAGATRGGGTSTSGSGGGSSGSGGSLGSGGTKSTGGSGAGGAPGSGGLVGVGGAVAGATSTGGTIGIGGFTAVSVGGSNGQGGAAGVGGSNGQGGAVGVGGSNGQGGAVGVGGGTGSSTAIIRNDMFWKDTSGTPIYSQGGGVLQVGDSFYWYGVKYNGAVTYAANPTKQNSDTSFAGVTIYSSKDLANWKLENTVSFSNAGAWFGRLGVVYNSKTKKYVMVAQGAGGEFFATSDTPAGDFVFDNVATNLTGIANGSTGDQTLFQDDDGKAYLICSSSSGRANLYVVPLRDSDFLAIGTPTRIFGGAGREGNAMFKYDGHYYFCSSDLHGWNSSHTYCISSTNILGPYGAEFVMTNTDADFSHVTQTGFFITVKGTSQSFVIFAGDRWSDFAGNGLGYNQWIPLSFNGTTPIFQSLSEWSIDAAAGIWSVGANNNYALNPSFEADRVSVTLPAGWTTSNGTNLAGGHTGRWSWQLTGASSLSQALTGLPSGTYTLSAWIKGSGASGAQLYAKGFGGTDASTSLSSAGGTWTKMTVTGIAVSNGKSELGITTTTGSITVDDFSFVKG